MIKKLFSRHPITIIISFNIFLFLLFLLLLELFLRIFAPIGYSNVGYLHSPNGLKYGWGFAPYDVVRIENPDTHKVIYDSVNNHGWRDRNRTYNNKRKSFRVVVLGDSEVFGYIVPKEKTFTYLLEERFKKDGKNVEIINIAYSGWSTNQQLEALEKDALKYNPDLVVINFVGNDSFENIIHLDESKFGNRIPFFHEIDATGELKRYNNPRFVQEMSSVTRQYLVSKFEILKRLWLVRLILKNQKRKEHVIATGQINILGLILADKLPKNFLIELERNKGIEMSQSELINFLNRFKLSDYKKQIILRISENRGFLREFNGFGLYKKPNYANTSFGKNEKEKEIFRWALYSKIMKKMKFLLENKKIPLAITSDYGPKRYDWSTYWHLASGLESEKDDFLKINDKLRAFAIKNEMLFINPPLNDLRARNDPHLNEGGHHAKAESLYQFLMLNFNRQISLR
jgi:hypothetical protein